jgi:hypothetical protein
MRAGLGYSKIVDWEQRTPWNRKCAASPTPGSGHFALQPASGLRTRSFVQLSFKNAYRVLDCRFDFKAISHPSMPGVPVMGQPLVQVPHVKQAFKWIFDK